MLPGTMFAPPGDPPTRQLRMAFANVSAEGLRTLGDRLATLATIAA